MILTDTGPLIGLICEKGPAHPGCVQTFASFPADKLLTTWPCLTEAMHILFRMEGFSGQLTLWQMLARRHLLIHDLSGTDQERMMELMGKYQDLPMDLADASLVVVAESLKLKKIFTLDSDFLIYRLKDNSTLEMIR